MSHFRERVHETTLGYRCRPDLGTLKTMCHRLIKHYRLRKRWDENTPSSKGPHRKWDINVLIVTFLRRYSSVPLRRELGATRLLAEATAELS